MQTHTTKMLNVLIKTGLNSFLLSHTSKCIQNIIPSYIPLVGAGEMVHGIFKKQIQIFLEAEIQLPLINLLSAKAV